MQNRKVFILTISAMAVAINIVLGTIVQKLGIPLLFLDTLGTILIAVLFGPWQGAAVGTVTNLLTPILTGNPKDIPFFIVNAAVGLTVGYIARRYGFKPLAAIIAGVIISIVAPLIGTPIAVGLYGGLTGSGNDLVFTWLKNSGSSIFSAAFIPRIYGNFIDKIGCCILVCLSLKYLPAQYTNRAQQESAIGK